MQKFSVMKVSKKLSYGQSNFEIIRKENYAYVDKTRLIEMIENEPNSYHGNRTDVRYLSVVFTGKTKYWIEECNIIYNIK